MATKKTLTPDEYQIIDNDSEVGIIYNVEPLAQPTRHSCWAISTAALFKFAGLLDKDLAKVEDPELYLPENHDFNQMPESHFAYVSTLMKVFFNFIKQYRFNESSGEVLSSQFQRLYENLYQLKQYDYTQKYRTFGDYRRKEPGADLCDWYCNNLTYLYNQVLSEIKFGEYGRFQKNNSDTDNWHIASMLDALTDSCLTYENDRRNDWRLEQVPDLKKYFPNEPDNFNIYNARIDTNGNPVYSEIAEEDVKRLIQAYFSDSDSSSLPYDPHKREQFFETLCGLQPRQLENTRDGSGDKYVVIEFMYLLKTYGPLLVEIDLDRETTEEGRMSSHLVVLCGIVHKKRSIVFTVMDPMNGRLEEITQNDFLDSYSTITRDQSFLKEHGQITDTVPQIYHFPEGSIAIPNNNSSAPSENA